MKDKREIRHFYGKIFIAGTMLIVGIAVVLVGIVYYWSSCYYSKLFEDRVIDERTLEYSESIGLENEWILGISTTSIDILEVIYNETVSEHIHKKALSQEEIFKLYKEKVDGKDLIYCISLQNENGAYLYRYSVIRDLYREIFPHIVFSLFLFLCFAICALYIYTKFIDRQFYRNLTKLQKYIQKLEKLDISVEPIEIDSNDKIINVLAKTFRNMHMKLLEKDKLQNSSLQYISHEMKSPIMIIESYVVSAKDGIYPNDTLEGSFDIILLQTQRMKEKVASLLEFVTFSTKDMQREFFSLSDLFADVLKEYQMQMSTVSTYVVQIEPSMEIFADRNQVQVILQNLIENQIKYAQTYAAIRAFTKDDKTILLFYNDGEPLSLELKEQIFTPFTKGYNGSNGLGLSICKTILLKHGRDIAIINTKQGTLFRVIL